jgi:hypothetical protein
MAVAIDHNKCRHCDADIALRVYASTAPHGVKIWTSGNGQFPGDQMFCPDEIVDEEGDTRRHEPPAL